MGYHKAYLKADAESRNLDLEKFIQQDTSSESDSSDDDGLGEKKRMYLQTFVIIVERYLYSTNNVKLLRLW